MKNQTTEGILREALVSTLRLTLQIVAEVRVKHQSYYAQEACNEIATKIRSEISTLI